MTVMPARARLIAQNRETLTLAEREALAVELAVTDCPFCHRDNIVLAVDKDGEVQYIEATPNESGTLIVTRAIADTGHRGVTLAVQTLVTNAAKAHRSGGWRTYRLHKPECPKSAEWSKPGSRKVKARTTARPKRGRA